MAQPKNFGFGEDEKMLRDTAQKFLKENAPVDKLHQLVAGDPDPYRSPECLWDKKIWENIVEMGWTTVAVPESAGGMGMSVVALAALAEEVGRAALPSPFIATVNATLVLRECDNDVAARLLGEIATGKAMTLAGVNKLGSWKSTDTDVSAEGAVDVDGDVILNGDAYFVQDAGKSEMLIVKAKNAAGVGLYAVPTDTKGLDIVLDSIIDLTRDQAHIHFNNVKISADHVIAQGNDGAEALDRAEPAILTVVAADMCGAGEWQLQTTVEYVNTREQFGHTLGYFQAVKHPIVNMMVMIDQAKSLVYNAACAIDSEPENAMKFARMANAMGSDVAAFCSNRAIQFHGGIGFTWECYLHLYTKRQKHNQVMYGDAKYQRTKLAEILMGPIAA